MVQNGLLLRATQRPAGRVVRRIQNQHACARRHRVQQGLHIQNPGPIQGPQTHGVHIAAHDARLRHQVGPHGRDRNDPAAGVDQRLRGQHQRVHTPRGHRDPVHSHSADSTVAQRHIGRDGLAQGRHTEVVGIKSFAPCQGLHCGLADEGRRGLIALAEPKGQHIAAAQTGVGDLADFGFFELQDGWTHGDFQFWAVLSGAGGLLYRRRWRGGSAVGGFQDRRHCNHHPTHAFQQRHALAAHQRGRQQRHHQFGN